MPGVFLVNSDNETLVRMSQAEYLDEKDLQSLIAKQPALLGGCTSEREEDEGRLLLIKREMGVPDRENGNGRWSMDHFYIDQTGVPVFVEVKRSKNSEVRRAVIGQLLDYAANGQRYWSVAGIKEAFDHEWGTQAEEQLNAFLEDAGIDDATDFWDSVEANLRRNNIRLVFVADELPSELKRVIEFLNEQMKDVEVLGIELRQFKAESHQQRVIAPTLVGRTAQAAITKGRSIGEARTYEDLDAVVAQFRNISQGQPPVLGRSGPYRKIRLAKDVPSNVHYEFLKSARHGNDISSEFHVESREHQAALQHAMQQLSGTAVSSGRIEYFPRTVNGALRLVLSDETKDPAVIANAMLEFINATKAPLREAALQDVGTGSS